MARPQTPSITARKQPQQQRSTQLVADVLEAAIRVLQSEGAARFTMARVADKAGVSVGSLYQYFPNKEAILFQLQSQEWQRTATILEEILAPSATPPLTRLRVAVRAFFDSECDEAELRVALEDAAPLYRTAPEAQAHRKKASRFIDAFLAEVMPAASKQKRAFAADLLTTTMSAMGKRVSEQGRSRAEVTAFANATGEMLCNYLDGLAKSQRPNVILRRGSDLVVWRYA
jgi:AcrR family transcriptional regulator